MATIGAYGGFFMLTERGHDRLSDIQTSPIMTCATSSPCGPGTDAPPNRGLPVWLALHVHGVAQFRATLDRMLDLAEHAAGRLPAIDGIELVGEPSLSVVALRATDDTATRRIHDALNDSGEVYVSSTTVDGRMYVRFALLSQRTRLDHVDRAIDVVARSMR